MRERATARLGACVSARGAPDNRRRRRRRRSVIVVTPLRPPRSHSDIYGTRTTRFSSPPAASLFAPPVRSIASLFACEASQAALPRLRPFRRPPRSPRRATTSTTGEDDALHHDPAAVRRVRCPPARRCYTNLALSINSTARVPAVISSNRGPLPFGSQDN